MQVMKCRKYGVSSVDPQTSLNATREYLRRPQCTDISYEYLDKFVLRLLNPLRLLPKRGIPCLTSIRKLEADE